jgi:hypothetical protein
MSSAFVATISSGGGHLTTLGVHEIPDHGNSMTIETTYEHSRSPKHRRQRLQCMVTNDQLRDLRDAINDYLEGAP